MFSKTTKLKTQKNNKNKISVNEDLTPLIKHVYPKLHRAPLTLHYSAFVETLTEHPRWPWQCEWGSQNIKSTTQYSVTAL